MEKFELSRRELSLLNFYCGFNDAIYNIEYEIRRTKPIKTSETSVLHKQQKVHLQLIKSLKQRAIKFLNDENQESA